MNLQELLAELLDHLRGMWRYRWWAMAIAWLFMIGGALFVYSLPDIYRASTRVYVDTDNLLRQQMQGLTAMQNNLNEVQLLSRLVLTRPNLEKVAHATDLNLRVSNDEDFQSLITDLQDDIEVSGGRDNVFLFEYENPNRDKARDVVDAVRNIFVEGALGDQDSDLEQAERAMKAELELATNQVRDKELEIARFKQTNLGYMPDQAGDYYARLQNSQAELTRTRRARELAEISRDVLRRQVAGEEPVIGLMPTTSSYGRCSQGAQIAELEAEHKALMTRYRESFPRATVLKEMISSLEEACNAEVAAGSGGSSARAFAAAGGLDANPVYQNMQIQLSDAEVEVERLRAQETAQLQLVEQLTRDVDKILEVETQLNDLTRGADLQRARQQETQKKYDELLAKKRIDSVTSGVRFDTIDPPFASPDPVGPNRPLLLSLVLVMALGAGVALAFVMNQMRPVFFTRASLKRVLEYPVIGSISMLLPPEVVARRRMEAVTWAFVSVLLLAFAAITMLSASKAGPLLRNFMEGVGA